ncbi:MAG: tyrosine-type recombinase/integrase [Bacteroidia bacterium]
MKPESIEHYLNRTHTNRTAKTYLYYISVFKIKYPNAMQLEYSDIIQYINGLKKTTKETSKISPHITAVKKYYDYLLQTGQRNDHPCKSINLNLKKKPIQLQDLFSPSELELLMNRENRFIDLELRNKVIISLLIYQALVGSEISRLELKDVDLDNGTIYIKGSKKNSYRTLNLKPSQILLIQNYIDTSRKNLLKSTTNALLISQRGVGETVDGINSMIEPLKGLFPDRNLNPSTIRQSVISNLLNLSKQSLEAVQLFAGHKWPSSTEQYRRKDITEQREKINMWHPLK